jgi:NAD(P)H-flavin reductase
VVDHERDLVLIAGGTGLAPLRDYARSLPGLRVVPVTSEDPGFSGERGRVADIALQHGTWPNDEVHLCGSPEMVTNSLAALRSAGVPDEGIHHEEFAGTSAPPARPRGTGRNRPVSGVRVGNPYAAV